MYQLSFFDPQDPHGAACESVHVVPLYRPQQSKNQAPVTEFEATSSLCHLMGSVLGNSTTSIGPWVPSSPKSYSTKKTTRWGSWVLFTSQANYYGEIQNSRSLRNVLMLPFKRSNSKTRIHNERKHRFQQLLCFKLHKCASE